MGIFSTASIREFGSNKIRSIQEEPAKWMAACLAIAALGYVSFRIYTMRSKHRVSLQKYPVQRLEKCMLVALTPLVSVTVIAILRKKDKAQVARNTSGTAKYNFSWRNLDTFDPREGERTGTWTKAEIRKHEEKKLTKLRNECKQLWLTSPDQPTYHAKEKEYNEQLARINWLNREMGDAGKDPTFYGFTLNESNE